MLPQVVNKAPFIPNRKMMVAIILLLLPSSASTYSSSGTPREFGNCWHMGLQTNTFPLLSTEVLMTSVKGLHLHHKNRISSSGFLYQ